MNYFKENTTPKILLLAYIGLLIWSSINPYDRTTWWAENVPIMGIVATLIILYSRKVRFSATSYILMSCLVFLHTIGGHYTFERVPFDWFTNFFGFERNHYDRIAHFTVGFFAFPITEYIEQRDLSNRKKLTWLFAVFSIAFVAMGYELIEWVFAATEGGEAGTNFLGSQGDIWDAQKDMLADTLGAIAAASTYFITAKKKN